jgi:hypothetical protein
MRPLDPVHQRLDLAPEKFEHAAAIGIKASVDLLRLLHGRKFALGLPLSI